MEVKVLTKEDRLKIKRAEKKKRNKANKKSSAKPHSLSRDARPEEDSGSDNESDTVIEEQLEINDEALQKVIAKFNTAKPIPQEEPTSTQVDEDVHMDENSPEPEQASDQKPRMKRSRTKFTIAELKSLVQRPDLVEACDVNSPDPLFLLTLKAVTPFSVPVPVHWSSKRKFMANKRGVDRVPYKLPDFIEATGIARIRATVIRKEQEKTLKAKQREKIRPKTGKMDIDFKVLHDAFFKYQTKPSHLLKFGDLYFEGREQATRWTTKFPGKISPALKEALGMQDGAPPPWLINMQRFGPPPAYPRLKIPGLNAPIPFGANFGYHPGGWGQPPLDQFGNPRWGNWRDSDRQTGITETQYWGEMEPAEDAKSDSESDDVLDEEEAPPVQMVVEPVKRVAPAIPVERPATVVEESFQELFQVIPEKKVVSASSILPPTKGYVLSADDVRKKLEAHAQAAADTAAKAHVVEVEKKPKQKKFKF